MLVAGDLEDRNGVRGEFRDRERGVSGELFKLEAQGVTSIFVKESDVPRLLMPSPSVKPVIQRDRTSDR